MSADGNQKSVARKDKAHSMTVILIVTSMAYLIFSMPTCIVSVVTNSMDVLGSADTVLLVETLGVFGWFASMSTNFYLYLLSGERFRKEARKILCCGGADNEKQASSGMSS